MGIWAILPVKPLRRGKSRLAPVMEGLQRTTLNECLLENTLRILQSHPQIDNTLVISRDPQALAMARRYGARTLLEQSGSNLNRALEISTSLIRRSTYRGVLIVPADLPLVTGEDLAMLIDFSKRPPVVAIAPDRHRQGTNALLVCPPGLIRYTFGIGSFERHCELARAAGARLEIVERPGLALDLDLPEDLDLVRASYAGLDLDRAEMLSVALGSHSLNIPPLDIRQCLDLVKTNLTLKQEGVRND
jgi:2-phospho-L-lactate guanylyltransferase